MATVKAEVYARALKTDPGRYRGALVCGPNWDLVQRLKAETVGLLTMAHPDAEIVRLSSADVDNAPGKVLEELQGLSLFGSLKIVVFDAASASAYKECVSALSVGWEEAFLLVSAGDLKKSVALRKEFEASPHLACVICYEQTAGDLARVVSDRLQAMNVSADSAVCMAVVESVSGNAALLDAEIDKLLAFAGGTGALTLEDVEAVCAVNRSSALDETLDLVFTGRTDAVLTSLRDMRSDGVPASGVLVALTNHFWLLNQMVCASGGGRRADAVVKEWRPPVFWKRQSVIAEQVRKMAGLDLSQLVQAIHTANADSRNSHEIAWPLLERLCLAIASRLRSS